MTEQDTPKLRTIERFSLLSRDRHEMQIVLTDQQYAEIQNPGRRNLGSILPDHTPEEREFIMTGITPEEWNQLFLMEDEE